MAHIEKYKKAALSAMVAHYIRWGGDVDKIAVRGNIDPSLTPLNYNLGPDRDDDPLSFINRRIDALGLKRQPRKDAIHMCDCVVTMPRSLDPSRRDEFFRSTYGFLSARYGEKNVIGAWVHLDEPDAQPHMHFAWVPVTDDGRLSARDVCSRKDWRSLHPDMQAHLEGVMGCHVEVLLDEEKQGEKQLSHLNQREYRAAKKALKAMQKQVADAEKQLKEETRRLESVRREREAAERRVDVLERAASAVADAERDARSGGGDALSSFVARCRELVGEVVSGFTASMRSAWESLTGADGPRLTLRRRSATAYHGTMPEASGRDEGQDAGEVEQVTKTKELGRTLGK